MLGPNIREYNDYRAFLKAFASYKKLSQPTWSYGVWARSLGLKATTSLTMIINGQRHPGTKVLKSLTDYFNFTPYEEAHFLNLVNLEKVKNQQYLKNVLKRELHGTQLRSHKPVITSEVFKQINQWHFLALRQLARMGKLTQKFSNLKNQFNINISPTQFSHATKKLLSLGLLTKGIKGTLQPGPISILTEQDINNETIQSFHKQMIDLASRSISETSLENRELIGLTLPIDKSNLPQAKKLIREFIEKFNAILDAPEGNSVYQLNLQFFPLATECKKDDEI